MFIKYGEETHLLNLRDKGEIYCNPCRYFRDLEAEQQAKGIGDGQDGGICGEAEETTIIYQNSTQRVLGKSQSSIIVEPALNTPVFCMRKCLSEKISKEYRIVLPYEQIDKGKIYNINPFPAKVVKIDDLVE